MTDDRLSQLMAIAATMPATSQLTLEADQLKQSNHLAEAAARLASLSELLRQQIDLIEAYDLRFPTTPFGHGSSVGQLLNAMFTHSDLIETLGDRSQAEALRQEAMGLAEKHRAVVDLADRGRQRAASLLAQARYHEAANALLEARDEFERQGRPIEAAQVTVELGELYEWLGDFERAVALTSQATAMLSRLTTAGRPTFTGAFAALATGAFREAEGQARLAAASSGLMQLEARVLRSLKRFDEADVLFRRIQVEADPSVRPAADFQLARNEVERGEPDRGLALLATVIPRMTGILRPRLGAIQSWYAEALLALGRAAEAAVVAGESVDELRSIGDDDSLWRAEWRYARALRGTGRTAEAREVYLAAVSTVDRLRRAPMGYRLESTFFAEKAPLFDEVIHLTAGLGDAAACLATIEKVKSRALTAILTMPTGAPVADSPLAAAADGLSTRLDALEYERYRLGWDAASLDLRARLLAERAALLERTHLQDPRWRTLSRPVEFDSAAALATLAANQTAAISLYRRGEHLVAVLMAGGNLQVAGRQLTPATVGALDDYARNLRDSQPRHPQYDPASTDALEADALIPLSLLRLAIEYRGLVVIPHGELHLLPWSSMRFEGRRLFESLPVTVLPNASCLQVLGQRRPGPGGAALIGAPGTREFRPLGELPLVEAEILTVGSILGPRVFATASGPEATQAAFRRIIADPAGTGGILHLACHGDFVADAPENSGLLLSDGRLDVADITRARITFDDVVLSSCASGYRPTRVGDLELAADDAIGLPAAFLEAGARSVLVSIPPARDDAALDLMTRYYEFRSDGATPGRALQQAQQGLLRDGRMAAHLWAGFTVYGVD